MRNENELTISVGIVFRADVDAAKDIIDFISKNATLVYVKKSINKLRIEEENER